jgi:microcystin-dependent protein
MSDQYLAEIRIFATNFAPYQWAFCNGQILPISQNTALFSLIGTYYGGNGTSNFALPNLQACIAIGQGDGPGLTPRFLGEFAGEATVTLLQSEIAIHAHTFQAHATRGGVAHATPANNDALMVSSGGDAYSASAPNTLMGPQSLTVAGGSQPHNNVMPLLGLNYCIALAGVYPARN